MKNPIKVSFDQETFQLSIDSSNTNSNDNLLVYKVDFRPFTFDMSEANKIPQVMRISNYIIVKNEAQSNESDELINIEGSWAEFYFKTLKNPLFNPDPPSLNQIQQSDLSRSQKEYLMVRLYPETLALSTMT